MFNYIYFLTVVLVALLVAEFNLVFLVLPVFLARRGAPYVPSRKDSIKKMLVLANLKPGDKVVDLGSGDGRIVIAFARNGIDAHGYEISPALVLWSKLMIFALG